MGENTRRIENHTLEEKRALLERMLKQRSRPASRRVPASYAQQRLWLLTQLNPDAPTFNLHYAVRLRGRIDADALQTALIGVVRRHGSLRTTFEANEGRPEQVVHSEMNVPLELVDFSSMPLAQRYDAAREAAILERRKPFNLLRGPLLRAILQRITNEEHVLFLVLHHIVADGWSIGLLFRELGQLYKMALEKSDARLAQLPMQFFEFSRLQQEALSGADLRSQLEYWTKNLANLPPPLDLPTDGRRTATPTLEAESRMLMLDAQRLRALKALSRSAGVTPYATILMILQVLLHRICGEDDVVVGSPVAARTMANTEELIGFFVNMLVLRSDLSGNPDFRTLLGRVRDVTRGAFANQDVPFERLLEEVNPQRDLARTPIFQVYFNMLSFQSITPVFHGLDAEPLPPYEFEANFDLTLYAQEEQGGLNLSFVYRRGLFAAERIEELLHQFKLLFEGAIDDDNRRIGELSLITERAREVLPDPVAPIFDSQSPGSLTTLKWPTSASEIAVRSTDGVWTYGDLERRTDRIARALIGAGLQRGEVVAVYARRDPWLVGAMLGVLRAGGAFAIFDPAYPDATLVARWNAANPRALIIIGGDGIQRSGFAARIADSECRLRLDLHGTDVEVAQDSPERVVFPVVTPDDLAYVAFTSGTTGGVKAIIGTHGPVVHFLKWQREQFALGPEDRFSLLSGLSHDPLLRDVFAPLWSGATLCVPDAKLAGDTQRLAGWISEQCLTIAHLTPALIEMLGTAVESGGCADLRYAFVGGDALRAETVRQLRRIAPEARCVNFYGATETPQAMAYYVVPAGEEALRERIPLGRGIDGVQLLVMNEAGMQAGIGELGEIAVRTPYLSRGYLGDTPLTEKRFTTNPASGDEHDRVYWTGDLARYLPDGTVDFAGRRDNQIKLRGFRIEAGEVEAALCTHAEVAQAAVVLHSDGDREGQLVAYAVPEEGAVLEATELRRHIAARLPEYAVPTHYVMLPNLPLTPNGKVDRRALPAPQVEQLSQSYQAPRTPSEELVAGVYAEVLGLPRVGRLDGFFELGGHSLLAARVIARLNNQFQVALSLRTLFEKGTPAELAAQIDRLLQAGQTVAYQPIERRDPAKPAPLSYAQERLWYLHQLAPDTTAYNLAGALELRGDLNLEALEKALLAVVLRHEPLRTCIARVDGWPTQSVLEPSSFELQSIELSPSTSEDDLRLRVMSEVEQSFNVSQGSLLRATLFTISRTRRVLLFVCHHLVTDGWSMGVFARDLGQLYDRYARGEKFALEELPFRYTDYAVWQRQHLSGEHLDRLLEYWRAQLNGAPPYLDLPTDHRRPANFSYRGSRYSFRIPNELQKKLNQLSRREGVTLFMTLLAGFQVLLSRYSNQSDVVIGTPVANRSRPEFEQMIGFFVNTLVLRTALSNDEPFSELLRRVRDVCLNGYAHQQMPFEKLVEALRPPRDLSRNPLFQVMFVLQNMDLSPISLGEVEVIPYPVERSGSQMDLSLYMRETDDGLLAMFEYSTDLFEAKTIERVAVHLENLLQSIADAPDARLCDLSLLGPPERENILAMGRGPSRQLTGDENFLRLFENSVDRCPDAIAAVFGSSQASYVALDASANQLARHLTSLDVQPGSLVAVCLPRGIEMLTSVIAVLKSGGAYLPLDPEYPGDRLRYMLEDSGADALITTSAIGDDLLPGLALCKIEIDKDQRSIALRPSQRIAGIETEDCDLAYMIYTSGSTGKPKGVEIEHRSLTNFLHSMATEPGCGPGDTLVAVTTLSFDISILELLLPLAVGGRVVIADKETLSDGGELKSLIEQSNATMMQATPTTWRLLIDTGWEGKRDLKALCGGEPLPRKLAEQLLERVPELWNMYGPTETTIWSTCAQITDARSIHVGRPIANTDVYVLDDRMQLQPVGVPGHLYIGGTGVARGYHDRPELTAEKFVPNPVSGHGVIYGTGDRARWLEDGTIEHFGRIDNQVKLRGHRIEPGEIEACLAAHPHVKQCAVALRETRPGDQRLIAYFVADKQEQTTMTMLRAHLKEKLPQFMIPQLFVELDALPLTPNGKVDRKALPSPTGVTTGQVHVPPQTPAEKYLAQCWQEILGVERVGVSDNFFDIGGHSLLAARLVHQVGEHLGIRFTLQSLTSDTLGQIAATIPEDALGELTAAGNDLAAPQPRASAPATAAGYIRKLLGR